MQRTGPAPPSSGPPAEVVSCARPLRGLRAFSQSIADAPDGLDPLRFPAGFGHLAAQGLDVRIDGAIRERKSVSPDSIDELFACKYLPGSIEQGGKEFELHPRELNLLIAEHDATRQAFDG